MFSAVQTLNSNCITSCFRVNKVFLQDFSQCPLCVCTLILSLCLLLLGEAAVLCALAPHPALSRLLLFVLQSFLVGFGDQSKAILCILILNLRSVLYFCISVVWPSISNVRNQNPFLLLQIFFLDSYLSFKALVDTEQLEIHVLRRSSDYHFPSPILQKIDFLGCFA